MRIGHFVSNFPSKIVSKQVYGAGRVAYNLCKELAHRGHNIHVFVPSTKSSIENYKDVSVHFYNSFLRIGIMYVSHKLFFDSLHYDVDIIHIHNDTPISVLAGLRYKRRKKKPLVVTWHGDWIENYGSFLRRIGVFISNRFLVDKVLSEADVIITPSEHYIEESRFLKRYREKTVEISNGINLEDFNIPYSKEECKKILKMDSENIVLFLSALYPLKGPHILLKAIPEIVKKCKDVLFVFVGGGEVERYEKLAEQLGAQKYVRFTGYIEEKLKPLYYKAADIFVLPSIETFEVFPVVLLEASAAGLPMVVSDLKTFKCIIEEGYNGLFTKRGSEKDLADAIIYLLRNESTRKMMGKNAQKKVKAYSWKKIAEETEKVYKELVK